MIFNKKITIYFQNKNKWQIAPNLHKKSEKCDASRNYENVFFVIETKRERGGREGRRATTAKREEGAKEQGRT